MNIGKWRGAYPTIGIMGSKDLIREEDDLMRAIERFAENSDIAGFFDRFQMDGKKTKIVK